MDATERLAGNQPEPEKERRKVTCNKVIETLLGIQKDILQHIICIDTCPNLVAESKVNDLPQPSSMVRKDIRKP